GGASSGKVLQRFPEKDWPDAPFIDGIELFCQPQGWRLSASPQQPTFFVSVLTDVDANKHYCACLSFNEPIAIQPIKQPDDEDLFAEEYDVDSVCNSVDSSTQHHSIMYAPKCLVLVSRYSYPEIFKNCLGIIYTVYIDSLDFSLETLITNLLSSIEVPPPGGPPARFSLGAGDKQQIQPPLSPTVPVTGTTVYQLFEQLGIQSVITLFTAITTEHKILFHSKSYTRLHDACNALTSLMYPFNYCHVYIPLLPSSLLEVLSTPTPFVIGVHSSLKNEVEDLLDVITVDLDGGSISVPEHLPRLDEHTTSQLVNQLCLVIRPQLTQADDAFVSSQLKPSTPFLLDKEIRAIFVRLFAQLLQGYRTCLQIVRIHPKPFITFHKSSFLGQRNLVENEFVVRLLDCMFFNLFVKDRGPPFRPSDLFDELYATMNETLKREAKNSELILENIRHLAQQLYLNECPNPKDNFQPRVPQPTEGAFTRIHHPIFPVLKAELIEELIENERIQKEMTRKPSLTSGPKARIIPIGPEISASANCDSLITNSARRLEVMKNCVNCIFENKISDARKTFPAVLRALKNKFARLALAEELSYHISGKNAILDHEQFDLVVRLMNCALQQDCDYLDGSASGLRFSGFGDINGVAAAILPLSMAFCRRLSPGSMQFAYTCLQDHPIWNNLSFWEDAFYQNVEKAITALYSTTRKQECSETNESSVCLQPTPLDIAAEQIRLKPKLNEEKIKDLANNEEATVYSQAVHFAHQMVALKIPIDIGNHERIARTNKLHSSGFDGSDSNSNLTGTGAGRESVREDFDNESGFEDGPNNRGHGTSSEISANTIKFIGRFVDKVCTEGGVSEEHIKALHQIIPSFVALQCETLEGVYKDSRTLPPITKPKIITPDLLSGEELTMQGLRAYLIPDGREEVIGSSLTGSVGVHSPGGGPILLPAEGAIFITNYRVIFRGRPCDPFASECTIVRSFPIATLTKEKRINLPSNYLIAAIDQYIQEGLQLRSNTFQLIRIAFDEEVSSDAVEMLRKLINKARTPPNIFHLFAFTSQVAVSQQMKLLNLQKQKDKNATLRGIAKKTLLKTAAKAGLNVKSKYKRNKYFVPQGGGSSLTMAPIMRPQLSTIESVDERSLNDDISVTSDSSHVHSTTTLPPISGSTSNITSLAPISFKEKNSRTLKKLVDLNYVVDYERLGFGRRKDIVPTSGNNMSPSVSKASKINLVFENFRISTVNMNYAVCQSYPTYIVVPFTVTDESIRRFSRCYKYHRFPAIVWKHPKTQALLLRGSSFHGKGVIGMFKGTVASGSSATNGTSAQQYSNETTANLEQEKYFRAIVNLTPSERQRKTSVIVNAGSALSIPSLVFSGPGSLEHLADIGKDSKKQVVVTQFQKAMNTLRSSGGKSAINSFNKQLQKFSANTTKGSNDVDRISSSSSIASSTCASSIHQTFNSKTSSVNKVNVCVIGEKAQIRNIKAEQYPNCEFIPIEIHEVKQTKQSFKKLLRACCPSTAPTSDNSDNQSFYHQVENSEWLLQLQTIMQIAIGIVELIDSHGTSVILCLEDGTDFVPQIVSIVELCLDPYYRTFEGFRVLIEKEWLAFGHRFSHRSNHIAATLTSGFAPIFLQFLDIVHQIMNQFPLSFQFNHYYLKFIAYHYVSCRFRTFLLDCECEREEFGWLHEDLKKRVDDDDFDMEDNESTSSGNGTLTQNGINNTQINSVGTSFWDYAEKLWSKSSIFFNFHYIPTSYYNEDESCVLRPFYNMCNLQVWDYYLSEELCHGPSFDFEVVAMAKQRKEEFDATNDMSGATQQEEKRKIVNAIYDSIEHTQENSIQLLLETIKSLEAENPKYPKAKWINIWDRIEIPLMSTKNIGKMDSITKHGSVTSQILRRYCRAFQKRSTIDMLISNKLEVSSPTQPIEDNRFDIDGEHKFEKCNYSPPVACDYCKHLVCGLMKTGLRCVECGYNCHEQCLEFVPKICRIAKTPSSPSDTTPSENGQLNGSQTPSDLSPDISEPNQSNQYYNQFLTINTSLVENRTHEGYLYKKGSLLKSWKQRWFVLDSSKHQLRYYDSQYDNHCKGLIDLAEVISVVSCSHTGSAFFDLKTVRRTYNLMAIDSQTAQEWIENIQACLQ
ncbi:myotubularin-related protein 13-like isoform X4, partial [Dinothrombium tinctorium]